MGHEIASPTPQVMSRTSSGGMGRHAFLVSKLPAVAWGECSSISNPHMSDSLTFTSHTDVNYETGRLLSRVPHWSTLLLIIIYHLTEFEDLKKYLDIFVIEFRLRLGSGLDDPAVSTSDTDRRTRHRIEISKRIRSRTSCYPEQPCRKRLTHRCHHFVKMHVKLSIYGLQWLKMSEKTSKKRLQVPFGRRLQKQHRI